MKYQDTVHILYIANMVERLGSTDKYNTQNLLAKLPLVSIN